MAKCSVEISIQKLDKIYRLSGGVCEASEEFMQSMSNENNDSYFESITKKEKEMLSALISLKRDFESQLLSLGRPLSERNSRVGTHYADMNSLSDDGYHEFLMSTTRKRLLEVNNLIEKIKSGKQIKCEGRCLRLSKERVKTGHEFCVQCQSQIEKQEKRLGNNLPHMPYRYQRFRR